MINGFWTKWYIGMGFATAILIILTDYLINIVGEQYRYWIVGYLFALSILFGFLNYFCDRINEEYKSYLEKKQ